MMVGVPTRSGNTLRFPWEAAEPSAYRTYQWNILEAFLAQNIFVRRSIFFGYEQKLLISTAGGRFHFITVQGRHLFKKTTFTESTLDRKSTRLNSSHVAISYAVFCLKKKKNTKYSRM